MNKAALLKVAREKFAGLDKKYQGEFVFDDDVAIHAAIRNSFRVLHLAMDQPLILLDESGDYTLFSRLHGDDVVSFYVSNTTDMDATHDEVESYASNWLEDAMNRWEYVKQTGRLFPPDPEDPESDDEDDD